MIQLPHGSNSDVCKRVLHAIEKYGSHLFANAEWGCKAGVHCGWAIVSSTNAKGDTNGSPFRQDFGRRTQSVSETKWSRGSRIWTVDAE
jgi:hypothetical protein